MKKVFFISLLLLCAFAFSQSSDVVIYAFGSEMITLDPSTEFSNSIIVLNNVYETLTRFVDGEVIPILAESWSANEEGDIWTFKLRQGVKFHDGTEMTSEDVKYSIERCIRLGQGPAYIWDSVESIKTPDDYTVVFELSYPANIPLIAASGYGAFIFSSEVSKLGDDTEIAEWFNGGNEVGSGPYRLVKYDPKTQIVMKKFDDYWGGWTENKFENAVIQIVPDPSLRTQMILSNEVQITRDLIYDDIKVLESNPNVVVLNEPAFQVLYLFFNTQKHPFNNADFRKAVAYAIPFQDILRYVLMGYGRPPRGIIPQGMLGYANHLPPLNQDMKKAEEYLKKSGIDPDSVNLVLTYMQSDEGEKKSCELIWSALKKLGLNIEIRPMNWEQQWALARSDFQQAQDMFIMYWWPTIMSPYDFLFSMLHSEEEVLFNLCYYYNSEVDNLMDTAVTLEGIDPAKADSLYKQIETIVREDMPIVPLYQIDDIYVMSKAVKNFDPNPAYPNVVFFYNVESAF